MRLRSGDGPVRLSVGRKFGTAMAVLTLAGLAVSGSAMTATSELRRDVDRLIGDDLGSVRTISDLVIVLYDAEATALRLAAEGSDDAKQAATLDQVLVPRLGEQLARTREKLSGNEPATRRLERVGRELDGYVRLRREADAAPTGSAAARAASPERIAAIFNRMIDEVKVVRADRYAATVRSGQEAQASYRSGVLRLGAGAALTVLGTVLIVVLLVRNLVPRIRSYARFATAVAAGREAGCLEPRGSDELADLGHALNDLVTQGEAARRTDAEQAEFADTLQVTAGEEEADDLVKRHLERSLPGSETVVLKRNNSENRLDAATPLTPGSPLAARLPGAEPRACLALRFGRTHRQDPARTPLLDCALCAGRDARSTCEPLLVGGQVIGSVLVTHEEALGPDEEARIRTSVAQAAPVLGNLRNLALAEFRANNDSLTGLPNKRATDDSLKRMVAQANRSVTPLSALMLDLDHFKQVNDRFGHAKGDEVLAAVGIALRSSLRTSDFAGRFGGEELLVLLPDTTAEGAVTVAEKIRTTIEALSVPGVDRPITVSIGIADLIQHGGDAAGLLRQADKALYAAKAGGRNRTVVATSLRGAHPGDAAPAGAADREPARVDNGTPLSHG